MNVCVFSMYGSNFAEIAAVTQPVLQQYCAKQGYAYSELLLEGTGNDYAYKKHEYIKELFKQDIDVIWYVDCDLLITNPEIPVTQFLDDDYSVFLTRDFNEINNGSLLCRNDYNGRWFNDYILSRRDKYENEQNIINANEFSFKEFMKELPHPSINSYLYKEYVECKSYVGKPELGDWTPDCLTLHVPGLGLERRWEILSQHKTK